VLTDRQTDTQTDTTENNTPLVRGCLKCVELEHRSSTVVKNVKYATETSSK